MRRQAHRDAVHAWRTAAEQIGVKELRTVGQGLLTDEAAGRAGLSLVWRNGPTQGSSHRLKLLNRQA